jgi:hypothetical protein
MLSIIMIIVVVVNLFSNRAAFFWQPSLYVYTVVGTIMLYTLLYQAVLVPSWTTFGIDYSHLFQFKHLHGSKLDNPLTSLLVTVGRHVSIITLYFFSLLCYTLFSQSDVALLAVIGEVDVSYILMLIIICSYKTDRLYEQQGIFPRWCCWHL